MALGAHTVAGPRIQRCRIHDCLEVHGLTCGMPRNMTPTRSVTPFTADAPFQKRRVLVTVLSAWDRLHAAGMAFETFGFNRTHQKQLVVLLIARSQVPFAGARVVRNGGLKEKTSHREEIAPADVARTDEMRQLLCATDLRRTCKLFLSISKQISFSL